MLWRISGIIVLWKDVRLHAAVSDLVGSEMGLDSELMLMHTFWAICLACRHRHGWTAKGWWCAGYVAEW